MCFPEKLIVLLAKNVVIKRKELFEKAAKEKRRKLTSSEKEELTQEAFRVILKDYAKKDDWKELKSAIGKKMNQWRWEKETEKEARWLLLIQEAERMELAEMAHMGLIDPNQDEPTESLEEDSWLQIK